MKEHINSLYESFDALGEMDAALDDSVSVSVILASLGIDYDALVTAIEA